MTAGLELATGNVKHFPMFPGLSTVLFSAGINHEADGLVGALTAAG